ncbi:MAG: adenylate kinase [Candidatus Binataceae bacterium]
MGGHTTMARVAVVGTTGSGKTRLARRLAEALAAEYVELDALFWGKNWIERPLEVFQQSATAAAARDKWVIDGNYAAVRPAVWGRADTLVWLDYSFALVVYRLLRRTVHRIVTRQALFSGNRESFATAFMSRKSLFVWAWQTHWSRQERYPIEFAAPQYRHLKVVRLRSPRDAERFLTSVKTAASHDTRDRA